MERRARRQLLVGLLAVVLVGAAVYLWWPAAPSGTSTAASNPGTGHPPAPRQAAGAAPVVDVHLEALKTERPTPGDAERNLFRFQPKAAPAPPRPPAPPPSPAPPPPNTQAPAQGSGLAPITLKFFGVVARPGQPKIAALSDGAGHTFYGREGDIIEGRYRIVRIGEESIEMSYPDGRGRQTIRLTGS